MGYVRSIDCWVTVGLSIATGPTTPEVNIERESIDRLVTVGVSIDTGYGRSID